MSETEMMAEPDWLAAEPGDRAKLTAIMAAVRRCYAECRVVHTSEVSGPHLTTLMAELFIGQLLMTTRASEREACAQTAGELGARYDETKPCGCGRPRPDGSPCVVLIRSGLPFADLLREDQ